MHRIRILSVGDSLQPLFDEVGVENVPDFVVATTGRLLDHCKNTLGFSLEDVEILVLDEADRLLEMGFKDELMSIVSLCKNPKR